MIFANRKQTLALTLAPGIALALGTDYPRSLSVTKPSPSLYLSLYLVIISNQTLALALSRYNSLKNILSCYYIACDGAAANLRPTLVLTLGIDYLAIISNQTLALAFALGAIRHSYHSISLS